jgi:hypothetical protein
MKNLTTTLVVLSLSTLCLLTGAYGQTGADSSSGSSPNIPARRRVAQLRERSGRVARADTQPQSEATRLDHAALDRIPRNQAPHAALHNSQRLPGAPVAAERYVFGRMDLATTDYPVAVAIGAFQTGGPQSIAAANYYANTISILLSNPDGTFQAKTDYATGSYPEGIAVGDFNGDGNLDLAVANFYSNVSILIGNGDGTFKPQVAYSCISYCLDVIAGDFNRDGKLDLAVSTYDPNGVVILLGNGDGTFQTPVVTYAAGDWPVSLVAGDFNGDGFLDLATANEFTDTVSVFLGKGDGPFNPRSNTSRATSPKGSLPPISMATTNSTWSRQTVVQIPYRYF